MVHTMLFGSAHSLGDALWNVVTCCRLPALFCVLVLSFVGTGIPESLAGGSSVVYAQAVPMPDQYETPRGLALGTGARASASGLSALAYQPAALALQSMYAMEGFVGARPSTGAWVLGAGVVDTVTSQLAAGFSFRSVLGDRGDTAVGTDARFGFALPLGEVLALGGALRYVSLDGDPADGVPIENRIRAKGLTADATLSLRLSNGVRLAFLGENLIDLDSPLAPVRVGASLAIASGGTLSVTADALVDMSTFEQEEWWVGGGLEYLGIASLPLRFGYAVDTGRDMHFMTGGFGLIKSGMGLEAALRQSVHGESATEFLVSIRTRVGN